MVTETETIMLILNTPRFGRLEVEEADIVEFVTPLPPFAGRRYLLLYRPEEEPFVWLQSVEEPALALVLMPYEVISATPPPALTPQLAAELGLAAGEPSEAFVTISLGETAQQATANLLAPVYLCRRTRRARQVIGDGDLSLTRVPLF
jgi:flagellar assembly factor FliW